jgi:predicted nucleotidyltransferase component of viral defense system
VAKIIKKNPSESIYQRLKNLSKERNRPFDEILRYYAMERFLYRLSISPYASRFFLKGGLMLKVWDSMGHRATMDIDFLAKTSNQLENIKLIITEVGAIAYEADVVIFDVQKLILKNTQTAGDYNGISASFSASLYKARVPILIDIGFSDEIIPSPQKFLYPTLLEMPQPTLLGYTLETIIAEKLESIVKLSLVNTRMKDFYDIWSLLHQYEIDPTNLTEAIKKVFENRKTIFKFPVAFTSAFYESHEVKKRWSNFLSGMGREQIDLKNAIEGIITKLKFFNSDLIG